MRFVICQPLKDSPGQTKEWREAWAIWNGLSNNSCLWLYKNGRVNHPAFIGMPVGDGKAEKLKYAFELDDSTYCKTKEQAEEICRQYGHTFISEEDYDRENEARHKDAGNVLGAD